MSRMRYVMAVTAAVSSLALGDTKPRDPFAEANSILTRHCAPCHQAADHPGAMLLNKDRLAESETISRILKVVEASQMPPAHRDFKNTEDGKKLLKWLRSERKRHREADKK